MQIFKRNSLHPLLSKLNVLWTLVKSYDLVRVVGFKALVDISSFFSQIIPIHLQPTRTDNRIRDVREIFFDLPFRPLYPTGNGRGRKVKGPRYSQVGRPLQIEQKDPLGVTGECRYRLEETIGGFIRNH